VPVDESAHLREEGHLALSAMVCHCGNGNREPKGVAMFTELTEELLDLRSTVRGYGVAVYAANEEGSSSGSLCTTIVLCCCHLCW
jgi:hypothetical protein